MKSFDSCHNYRIEPGSDYHFSALNLAILVSCRFTRAKIPTGQNCISLASRRHAGQHLIPSSMEFTDQIRNCLRSTALTISCYSIRSSGLLAGTITPGWLFKPLAWHTARNTAIFCLQISRTGRRSLFLTAHDETLTWLVS